MTNFSDLRAEKHGDKITMLFRALRILFIGDYQMFKKNVVKLIVAVALTLAVTVGSGVVAEQVGLSVVPQAHACVDQGSTGGGGC